MNANPMINPNIQMLMQLMQRGPNAAQQQQFPLVGGASQSAPAQQPPMGPQLMDFLMQRSRSPAPAPAPQAFTPRSLRDIIPEDAPATGPQMGPPTPEPQTGPQTPGAPASAPVDNQNSDYHNFLASIAEGGPERWSQMQAQQAELQELLSQRRDTAGQFREGREAIDAQRPERFTTMSEDQRKALNDEFYDSLIAASSRPGSSFGMALGESLQARGARRRENVDRNEARWERDRDRQMREMVQGLQLEAGDDAATLQAKVQGMASLQNMFVIEHGAGRDNQTMKDAERAERVRVAERERTEQVRVAERKETLEIAQRHHDENRADRRERAVDFNLIQTMHNGQPVQAFYTVDRSAPEGQQIKIMTDEDGELLYLPSQGSLRAAETAAERRRIIESHGEAIVRLANTGYFGENNRLSKDEAERLSSLSVDRWPVLAGMYKQIDEAIGDPQRQRAMQAVIDFAKGRGSPTTGTPTTTEETQTTTAEEPRPRPQLSTGQYHPGYLRSQQGRLGGDGR